MDIGANKSVEQAMSISDKKDQESGGRFGAPSRYPLSKKGIPNIDDILGAMIDEIPPEIMEIITPLVEERDTLRGELEFALKRLEEVKADYGINPYECLINKAFFYEAKKRYKYCVENNIVCSMILLKLGNYYNIRQMHGVEGGEHLLLNTSSIIRSVSHESDIIGLPFEYSFVLFIPFMSEEEADIFSSELKIKIENTSFYHRGNSITASIENASAEVRDEDLLKALYVMDLKLSSNR